MLYGDGISFSVSRMSFLLLDVVARLVLSSPSGFVVGSEEFVPVYAGWVSSSGTCAVAGTFSFPKGTSKDGSSLSGGVLERLLDGVAEAPLRLVLFLPCLVDCGVGLSLMEDMLFLLLVTGIFVVFDCVLLFVQAV